MPPQLVALTEGPNIPLDKPIVLMGRHQECDVQLGSRKVSRKHCCMAQVNDYLVIRDLGSTNGIRINGVRVLEGVLRPGDELTIGNQRYQVMWITSENPQGQGPPPVLALPGEAAGKQNSQLDSSDVPLVLAEESPSVMGRLPVSAPLPGTNGAPAAENVKMQPASADNPNPAH
jgi:predicted component of type VI protein secretion system